MRIAALSDPHGLLPETPPCDLLIVAGDFTPVTDHSPWGQRRWCQGLFADWLGQQPAERVVGICGNHDFIGEREPELLRAMPWT